MEGERKRNTDRKRVKIGENRESRNTEKNVKMEGQ